jgi:hypothetical protein
VVEYTTVAHITERGAWISSPVQHKSSCLALARLNQRLTELTELIVAERDEEGILKQSRGE